MQSIIEAVALFSFINQYTSDPRLRDAFSIGTAKKLNDLKCSFISRSECDAKIKQKKLQLCSYLTISDTFKT